MTSVSRGGLELYVLELILKLHAAGLKQVVICDENSFIVSELRAKNIPVEFLKPGSRYSLFRIRKLRQVHRLYGVTLWQSHQRDDMIIVALTFFFTNIRHIFSLYMGFAHKKDLLHRLVYSRLEKLVTTSHLMNSLALDRLPVKPSQIACIRYGRETNAFKVPAAKIRAVKKSLGVRPGQKIVLSLCRIDPMKGVREFADAARLVDGKLRKKLIFLQIGERTILEFDAQKKPIYRPESEEAYSYLQNITGAPYTLLPFQKDFVPYLLAADYFVLASYDEMYSLSLVDALMAKCLVIGTDNGGTTEQLADGRGILVATKSAAAIRDALVSAEGNPALRNKIRKTAHAWAMREHNWKYVLPQWLALYNLR